MPMLEIEGRRVQVGDDFLRLPKEQQDATVEEIARGFGPNTWGMANSAADMLTFGAQSKINAAGGALIDATIDAARGKGWNWSDKYNRQLEDQRADHGAYARQHPVRHRLGQAGGVVAGAAALPMAAPFKGGGLLSASGNAALTGAGYGGAAGALEDADSIQDRAKNTAAGVGTGVFIGGVIPPLAKGVAKTWQAVSSYMANKGMGAKAAHAIANEMRAAGLTPQQALARMKQLGPEAMLADTAPAMQAATAGTALSDSGAGNLVTQRLAARRGGGQARVSNMLDDAFGPKADPYTVKEATKATQRSTGGTYNRAQEYAVDTDTAADLVQQEIMRTGPNGPIGRALQELRAMLTDAKGNLVARGDQVHAIREQLDDMIESANRAGQGELAAKLIQVRRSVDESLKKGIPGFADADKTYASAARQQRAYEEGLNDILTKRTTPEGLRAAIKQSSAPENAMRAQGVRTEIDRVLSNQRRDPGLATDNLLTRDWNADKVGALVGPSKADMLRRGIGREATFRETSNLAEQGRGSRTAVLEAAQRMWNQDKKPGILSSIASGAVQGGAIGGAPGAMGGATLAGANTLRQRVTSMLSGKAKPEIIRQAADILTAQGPAGEAAVARLEQMMAKLGNREQTAATIFRLLNAALVPQASGQGAAVAVGGPR